MKPAIPWSVKGVEQETREAAKAAARRAGMTLGAWLNHMVAQSGDEAALARRHIALAPDPAEEAPEETAGEPAEIAVVLDRLDALESHQNNAIQHLEHALEMLASRVPPPGQAAPGAVPAIEPRLKELETDSRRRFDRIAKELGMIANRYGDLEERQETGRQELARMIEEVAKKPAPGPAKGGSADAKLVETLEKRLKAMEERLEAVGRDGRNAATTFQQALSAVMGRVVEGEHRQRDQANRLEQRFENFDTKLYDFDSKIDSLADRLEQAALREGTGDSESVHRLEQMVGAVTRQFEVVESRRERSHLAMERTLRALAERLAETDRRHAEHVEEPLAALNQAVEDMSRRMAETRSALETRLADVTERFEQGDTEFRASRFSLMHSLDETRRRVEALEEGGAVPPPLIEEPRFSPPPRQAAQSSAAAASMFAPIEAERMPRAEPGFEQPAAQQRNYFSDDRDAEGEPPAAFAAHDEPVVLDEVADMGAPVEAVDEQKAAEFQREADGDPVSALLAAAREAARARAPLGQDDAIEDEAVAASFTVSGPFEEEAQRHAQLSGRLSKKLSKGQMPKIAVAVAVVASVIAAGVIGLMLSAPAKKTPAERPGLVQSLLSGSSSYAYERDTADETALGAEPGVPVSPVPAAQAPVENAPLEAAPAAPAAAVAPQDKDAFVAPPEPASNQELASLATSAIGDVRAAASPVDMAKAAEKVTQAAMLGDAEAQFTLGRLYEVGQGVAADLPTARHWYEEAAAQGHAGAAFNIGMMEAKAGTPEAYQRAAQWFEHAAQKGYADAQYNLAMLYARGLGVTKDEAQAYAWFAAAASRGDKAAAAERERLSQTLDPATRAQGETLARTRVRS